MAFALTIASRKLRPYFQAHTNKVLTEYLLKKVLRKLDLSGRLVNWAVELSEFDIEFVPRSAIKGQVLADFVAEFTNVTEEMPPVKGLWIIYMDGSVAKKSGGARIVINAPDGKKLYNSLRLEFRVTNNEAEYEAVIAGLKIAQEMGAEYVELRSDSQVIVGHIQGVFKAKGERMKLYLSQVQDMQASLKQFCIVKIPREQNNEADLLARMGSGTTKDLERKVNVPIRILARPTVLKEAVILVLGVIPPWADELVNYLQKGDLPTDKKAAIRLKVKAAQFTLINDTLYKRGFMLPLLKCVSQEEGDYILREIHEGICGNHSSLRMLAHKAIRARFYWPNMNRDSMRIVQTCDKCQRFTNVSQRLPEDLSSVSSPWPFSQWGVDLVGPFPQGKGGVWFAVVAVDYFTKWAEAKALSSITAKCIEKFLWKNIICRHGIPHAFVTNNGKQFDCESFREWCAKLKIRNYFSLPSHPPSKRSGGGHQ
jgi:ribonuclease HI